LKWDHDFFIFLYLIFKVVFHKIQLLLWFFLIKCAHWHKMLVPKTHNLLQSLSTLSEGGVLFLEKLKDNPTWMMGPSCPFLPDMIVVFFQVLLAISLGVPTVAFFCGLWVSPHAGWPTYSNPRICSFNHWSILTTHTLNHHVTSILH